MNKVILYQIYKKCKLILILLKAAQWYLLITRKHTIKCSFSVMCWCGSILMIPSKNLNFLNKISFFRTVINTFRPEFDLKKEWVIYNTMNILNTNKVTNVIFTIIILDKLKNYYTPLFKIIFHVLNIIL